MDEDPSNEAFVLSLLEGYDIDKAEAMEIEVAPTRKTISRKAKSFTVVYDELYKRTASGVLKRCIPIP
jgi:hypothetical protein